MKLLRAIAAGAILLTSLWLIFAASWKFLHHAEFGQILTEHGLVSKDLVPLASWIVPVVEAATGIIALASVATARLRLAAALISISFLGFCLYALTLNRIPPPAPVSCGCGLSPAIVHDWSILALRNGAIGLFFATVPFWARSRPGRNVAPQGTPSEPTSAPS